MFQFVVFLQDQTADEIIDSCCDEIGVIPAHSEYKERLIQSLSEWDYGEYTEDPVTEEEFLSEIGSSGQVYYGKNNYVLVTYPHSALALYRILPD